MKSYIIYKISSLVKRYNSNFRFFYYALFLLISPLFGACEFLEVESVGKTTISVFFTDMDGIRAALPGAYSKVYNYYDGPFLKYPEVAGNMTYLNIVSNSVDMMEQYNFVSDPSDEYGVVGLIWLNIYKALVNINNIIQYQPDLLAKFPGNEKELNRILAEALFLRALAHFDLCRVYAQPYNYTSDASHLGIPVLLKTPGADDNVSRSSVKQVYDQIIIDLKKSISLFEQTSSREVYYASENAAYALLSRVSLYMEDWDAVIAYSGVLIDKVNLSGQDDYVAMFNEMAKGEEVIFRINGTDKRSELSNFYTPVSPVAIPADTLISLFNNKDDVRLKLLTDLNGNRACRKYLITSGVTESEKHYDPVIFRVTEMYLNRAEAFLNKSLLNEAASDLKKIIARGEGRDVSEIVINETDADALARSIDIERAKEFCFEGFRFFDITRRKKDLIRESSTNSSVLRINYPSDYFVLPISQKELEANTNIKPNPTVND